METQPDDSEKIFTKDDDFSPYDIADLVKMYFRELPEPLMTQKLSQTFISIFSGMWLTSSINDIRQMALQFTFTFISIT